MYKGKYLIGVYSPLEDGETLLGLCANAREFAELLGISDDCSRHILRLLFTHKTRWIRFGGRRCSVEFILDVE